MRGNDMVCFATALKAHEAWLRGEADGVRLVLQGANLQYANLRGADLQGANLQCANMQDVNLQGADLHGANMTGRTPIYADTARAFVLYVIPEAKEPMFVAGCRCFTLDEARKHWGPESEHSQPAYIEAIEKWVAASSAVANDESASAT